MNPTIGTQKIVKFNSQFAIEIGEFRSKFDKTQSNSGQNPSDEPPLTKRNALQELARRFKWFEGDLKQFKVNEV